MLTALKWGGIIGAAAYLFARLGLGLLSSALFGTSSPVDLDHPGPFSLACLGIFALLFAFSAAGYFAGRDTLKDGLGAVAGMIAFAIYAALSAIPLHLTGSQAPSTSTTPAAPSQNPATQAIVSFIALLFALGIAALMGWLGGRPGAMRARRRRATQQTHEAK
ncbi:MAG TPA: hypothetical protein VF510_05995 [Ktedonobacterales bacterium]